MTYRPNFNGGGKRLRFSVTTDSPSVPTIELILTATLHPSWSFRPVDGSAPTPVGRVGKLRYRAISNQAVPEEHSEPAVSLDPEDSARLAWIGPPVVARPETGFVQTSREIEVETNATTATGLHRAALVFRWADGRVVREEIMWVVEPAVSVVPSGLILQPSSEPTSQTLVVRSGSGPIRILEVSSPMIAGPVDLPAEPGQVHRLVVKLESSAVAAGGGSSIRILTDHPTQPEISIKILTLRTVGGGAP